MRAPPHIRKPRSRKVQIFILQLKRLCCLRNIKKKHNKRKLHSRNIWKNIRNNQYLQQTAPLSSIRIEDMVNLPTALNAVSARQKPLLIASFEEGCTERPNVTVLKRTIRSRVKLSKRKYKLSHFDEFETYLNGQKPFKSENPHECAHSIRTVKKAFLKNVDVRVVYHDKNTIKQQNLEMQHSYKKYKIKPDQKESNILTYSPKCINFGNCGSMRLNDYSIIEKNKPKPTEKLLDTKILGSENLNEIFHVNSNKVVNEIFNNIIDPTSGGSSNDVPNEIVESTLINIISHSKK